MSHISTEQRRAGARGYRRFNRGIWIAGVVSFVIAAAGVWGYSLEGPRLRSATVDQVAAVAGPGAILELSGDRALASISDNQVSVVPGAPLSTSVSGQTVSIRFDTALDYGTEYVVTVEGVNGESGSPDAEWTYSFSTPSAQFYYLDRDPEGPDRVMVSGVGAEPAAEVFSADQIDVFVPVGATIAVFVSTPSGSEVALVDPVTLRAEKMVLPPELLVVDVVTPAAGTTVFFTVSSIDGSDYSRTLMALDTTQPEPAQVVQGLTGGSLRVSAAAVRAGGSQLVAWVDESSAYLIDANTLQAVALAQDVTRVWGITSDGSEAILVDAGGPAALNLDTLEKTRIPPAPLSGIDVFDGQTHLLADGRRIQTVLLPDATGTSFISLVATGDDDGLRPLYRTPNDAGSIGAFVPSPSDQYVAIEMTPRAVGGVEDGYLVQPRDESVTLVIVDVDSGDIVRTVQGFWPIWAR
jgi:hypothetical protein